MILDLTRCPYCQARVTFSATSDHRYSQDYGALWECIPCGAWVGCHKRHEGTEPLGLVANRVDRDLRKRAHAVFDPLWKRKMEHGFSKHKARTAGYRWLANELGISVINCHISQMDGHQLRRVIALCEPWTEAL